MADEIDREKPLRGLAYTHESIRALARMGFDPIAEQVNLFKRISEEIQQVRYNANGTPKDKYPTEHFRELLGLQQKISNDLIRFAYARVPETTVVQHEVPSLGIQLTVEEDEREEVDRLLTQNKEGVYTIVETSTDRSTNS